MPYALRARGPRDGRLVYVRARVVLDGGAYASSSTAVCSNAACFAAGPYALPNARLDAYVTYTNNPPCGAMRGFGAVQVAVGHEAQMDKLAAALGIDPVELRIRNAMQPGSLMPTGQVIPEPAPVAELLERLRAMPLPPAAAEDGRDLRELPGGVSNTTHGEGVRRGVGYGLGFKNVGFSEGFDDYSTARVRLSLDGGEPLVEVHTAAAEVGQGSSRCRPRSPAPSSASSACGRRCGHAGRLGRVDARPRARPTSPAAPSRRPARPCASASRRWPASAGSPRPPPPCWPRARRSRRPSSGTTARPTGSTRTVRATRTCSSRSPPTARSSTSTPSSGRAGRRAGEPTQEVGKAMNPQALEGQIEGGTAQGMGIALLEEIQVSEGKVLNASFTDYLLPTILDMPPVRIEILEHADPEAPYGLKGVGEPPNISTPPAVAAALRDATAASCRASRSGPSTSWGGREARKETGSQGARAGEGRGTRGKLRREIRRERTRREEFPWQPMPLRRQAVQTDHPVDEVLPPGKLAVYGLQHVLAFYAGAVIVPILLAGAIGLEGDDLVYLIQADLFTCGVASIIQSSGSGRSASGCRCCRASRSSRSRR